MGMEFRDEIMLHCSRKVNCQQCCIPRIYYLFFELKSSFLRLRNLKKVFQQASVLKDRKGRLKILLDTYARFFTYLYLSFLFAVSVSYGYLCHWYDKKKSLSSKCLLHIKSTIFHLGGSYFSILSEISGKLFCILYLALVKPDLQLGTQHLRPMIGI